MIDRFRKTARRPILSHNHILLLTLGFLKTPRDIPGLLRVAEVVGTPTYVYDADTIRSRCRQFREALSGFSSRLLYAVKANANPSLIEVVLKEVDGLEVVSAGEVELARSMGVSPDRLLFSPNNISDEEMTYVAVRDVLFNVGELSRLERFGERYPGAEVSVRLNLWIGAGHHRHVVTGGEHSKFGLGPDDIDEALATARRYRIRIIGIHQHIGSGFENPQQYMEAIELLMHASRSFPDVRFINVGGGVGIPYGPDDRPFDLSAIASGLKSKLQTYQDETGRTLSVWFEPGRYLVAESGVLLVQATSVKTLGARTFVGTDSGFNHLLRPILYGAYHEVFNLSNPDGELETYDIAGNICESGDLFASDRRVQAIREGDLLAILDTGAYGMAMASQYNMRALPAEVLIDGDRLTQIRAREGYADMVARHLRETQPKSL